MQFLKIVVAVSIDEGAPRCSFPRWIWGIDQRLCRISHRCHFVDKDVERTASPTLVFVEGSPGFFKAHFLDVLVGALNECLNVRCRAHGLGADGTIRTS